MDSIRHLTDCRVAVRLAVDLALNWFMLNASQIIQVKYVKITVFVKYYLCMAFPIESLFYKSVMTPPPNK